MTNIRRYFEKEDLVFMTHVTHNRVPILAENAKLLHIAMNKHLSAWNAELIAWVILPDHFHIIIDTKHSRLSSLMRKIKLTFSASYRQRKRINSGKVWQNRFWDHIIRDQEDLNRHIDYIHYNPVKHGLATTPIEYGASSFTDYFVRGYYEHDWGKNFEVDVSIEYGE